MKSLLSVVSLSRTRSLACALLPAVFVISLAVPTLSLSAPDEPAESPAFLVQPYVQLPTPDGMTVMWETNAKLPGRVEYGLTRDLGQVVEDKTPTVLHELRLPCLKAGTTYSYRVRSGDLASEVYSFRTAPEPGTKRWRMALYGDSRSNPATHRKVVEQVARGKVELVLHTGDIVLDGKNHDRWRTEFFEPLGDLAHSTPWVSTIGNHERDSDNYFSYMALPGNERYFSFDYANAHIICLDSNAWIEKGRDSTQYQWLADDLKKKRDTTWTFVVFHHPLFSAHSTRPINALRWDWAPILLDPENKVDAVLTGHDHFYARNWRLGRASDKPQPGVLFLTSAGGGASLYPCKERDYVARAKSTHHCVLFDFDDNRVTLSAVDITGKEIDRYVLTKDATPPDEFCAYEVEEFRDLLRRSLVASPPSRTPTDPTAALSVAASLRVPTHFAIPITGRMEWEEVAGWKVKQPVVDFKLAAGQALDIPLQAEIARGAFARHPALTITFEPGKFLNRTVTVLPFQLRGPETLKVGRVGKAPEVDGKLDDACWQGVPAHGLLGIPAHGGRRDRVQVVADKEWVYVAARLDRVEGTTGEKVLVALSSGDETQVLSVSTDGERSAYGLNTEDLADNKWRGAAVDGREAWTVEIAVPRSLFADWSGARVNVIHRCNLLKEVREYHLCPACTMGTDPDRIADWRPKVIDDRATKLQLE